MDVVVATEQNEYEYEQVDQISTYRKHPLLLKKYHHNPPPFLFLSHLHLQEILAEYEQKRRIDSILEFTKPVLPLQNKLSR